MFACTRKERLLSRSGTPYLTIELRDSTGAIVARAFRDADVLAGRFERGELVRVRGRVERFRDELQIEVRTIARAEGVEADPTRFLPVAYRDLDELEGFLEHLAREVYDPGLKVLLERLLGDRRAAGRDSPRSLLGAADSASAAPGHAPRRRAGPQSNHHAYLGGLLEHTVAVATMALELCTLHPRLDRDLLVSAAIVHDLGKTREFTYGAEIGRSAEGRLLGHIELGLRLIADYVPPALAARAQAGAGALRDAPPRAGPAKPVAALRLARGARAVPTERARRPGEGRVRARRRLEQAADLLHRSGGQSQAGHAVPIEP